jgi:hypothetical protein
VIGVGRRRKALDAVAIGQVERFGVEDPPAALADLGGGRGQRLGLDVGQDERRAAPRRLERAGASDPTGGAGDEDGLAGDRATHRCTSDWIRSELISPASIE